MSDSNARRREAFARYFTEDNLIGTDEEIVSPSGRYRLMIRTYKTEPDRGACSRGTVFRVGDGKLVCDLERNLVGFHHSFVMKGDREYLIAGRSYMSQTVVNLDAGREYEPDGDHYNGHSFCWAKCYLSPDGNTLAVDGCYWACPYEYKFFDFTDPARGWRELKLAGAERLEDPSDKQPPRWLDATTIECFQCDSAGAPQERTRLRRRGDEMVVSEHWVAEPEQARRDEQARLDADEDAWWARFRSSDPMYLRFAERLSALGIRKSGMEYWSSKDAHVVGYDFRDDAGHKANLKWVVDANELELELKLSGETNETLSFEHSVAGIDACFDVLASVFRRPSR